MRAFLTAALIWASLVASATCENAIPYPGAPPTFLPPRLALIIGVQYYREAGSMNLRELEDAAIDADGMAELVQKLGFRPPTVVIGTPTHKYVDKTRIEEALQKFREDALRAKQDSGRAPILLVYFAGHGFHAEADNYLLPSSFSAHNIRQAKTNAINLKEDVIDILADIEPALQIVIIDSCRSPLPTNLNNLRGGTVQVWPGVKEPGRNLPDPISFGKNRVVLLYSTLDGAAAYAATDRGGRFTEELRRQGEEAWNAVQNPAPPGRKLSLQDLYNAVQYNMQFVRDRKWQLPQIDITRTPSHFFPLPTEDDFKQEKLSWEALDEIQNPRWSADIKRRICRLRQLLYEFSEFSYFSHQIINNLEHLLPLDPNASDTCPPGFSLINHGIINPPRRDPAGRWTVPAVEPAPVSPPRPSGDKGRSGVVASSQMIASATIMQVAADETRTSEGSRPDNTQLAQSPTFRDVRAAIQALPEPPPSGSLPADDVSLDKTVVTKEEVFMRTGAGVQYPIRRALPAGELVEVIRTSPGRTWLEVKHSDYGTGFISGNLVEPALVKVSKTISFEPKSYELNEEAKTELLTAFGLLGGAIVVDAIAEFPSSDFSAGFTRASVTAAYMQSVTQKSGLKADSRPLAVAIQPATDVPGPSPSTVRVTILCLPLDQTTRAALAQVSSSLSAVKLDVGFSGASEKPVDAEKIPAWPKKGDLKKWTTEQKVPLSICDAAGKNCRFVDPDLGPTNEVKKGIQKVIIDSKGQADKGKSTVKTIDEIIKLQPLTKF